MSDVMVRAAAGMSARAKVVLGFVAVLWIAEAIDWVLMGSLNGLGILPRTLTGLVGIPLAPFLHGDFGHLIANTAAIIPLGLLVTARKTSDFVRVSLPVVLLGGAAVWLLARGGTVHLGASGLVFGWLGYLLALGFYERSPRAVLVTVITGVFFGSLVFGVLPGDPRISWEGHLFGFVAGGLVARALARRRRRA